MTLIELAEPDDGWRDRSNSDSARVSHEARGIEELYGKPQHEVGCQPAEQMEAFYGEAQHDSLEECRWGDPFPWLLEDDDDDDADRCPPTCSRMEMPLRRLDRQKATTRR